MNKDDKTTLDQHAYYRGVILPVCYQQEMFYIAKQEEIEKLKHKLTKNKNHGSIK